MTEQDDAAVRRTWYGWLTLLLDTILCHLLCAVLAPIVVAIWLHDWWRAHRPPEVVVDE